MNEEELPGSLADARVVASMFKRAAGWLAGTRVEVRPLPARYEATLSPTARPRIERRAHDVVIELDVGAARPDDVHVYWTPHALLIDVRSGPKPVVVWSNVAGCEAALAEARLGFGTLTVRVPRRAVPAFPAQPASAWGAPARVEAA